MSEKLEDIEQELNSLFHESHENQAKVQFEFIQSFQDYPIDGLSESRRLAQIPLCLVDQSFIFRTIATQAKPTEKFLRAFIKPLLSLCEFYWDIGQLDSVHIAFQEFIDILQIFQPTFKSEANKLIPNILEVYIMLRRHIKFTEKDKLEIFDKIKDLMTMLPSQEQRSFVVDMALIILGVDIQVFGQNEDEIKIMSNYGIEQRMKILFDSIQRRFFPDLDGEDAFKTWFKQIYLIVFKIQKRFTDSFDELQSSIDIDKDIIKILADYKICSQELIEACIALLEGDLKTFAKKSLLSQNLLDIPNEKLFQMLAYLEDAQNLLKSDSVLPVSTKPKPVPLQFFKPQTYAIDKSEWEIILKGVKEGNVSSKDLFRLTDEQGDKNGSISEGEFQTLAARLGFKLSPHRIKEIFAKIKGEKSNNQTNSKDLDEGEFEQALIYLQVQNLQRALEVLGITPELLTATLIYLTILLLLIFVFIFLGIKAFAIGGTFGAIINSLFPIAGGLGLSKEKDAEKDKLEEGSVKGAADKAFQITASENL